MTERELILYACPTGLLADDLEAYFTEATARFGPTTAQTYPVHCTLTGFFRRQGQRAEAVLRRLGGVIDEIGPPPQGAVSVDRLGVREGWVGLELSSPWLLDLNDVFVGADDVNGDEDPLRPKSWLHVSLAYGVTDLAPYVELAREVVDPSRPVGWKVNLWERNMNGGWTVH